MQSTFNVIAMAPVSINRQQGLRPNVQLTSHVYLFIFIYYLSLFLLFKKYATLIVNRRSTSMERISFNFHQSDICRKFFLYITFCIFT